MDGRSDDEEREKNADHDHCQQKENDEAKR
jgi:hypothetical protein